jgi:hypothetical protein
MVFVPASPMCFHHNNVCNDITLLWSLMSFLHNYVCNGITLLWSPMCFLHNYVCNGIIVCVLLCFHAFPQHLSIALGSKLTFLN